jgi:hypothetical protein
MERSRGAMGPRLRKDDVAAQHAARTFSLF